MQDAISLRLVPPEQNQVQWWESVQRMPQAGRALQLQLVKSHRTASRHQEQGDTPTPASTRAGSRRRRWRAARSQLELDACSIHVGRFHGVFLSWPSPNRHQRPRVEGFPCASDGCPAGMCVWMLWISSASDCKQMGCLDPSSADVDDASNATGLIYTANSSQYSLPPSVALPVPQRQPLGRAFDFEDAHHLRSPLSSSRCRQPCASCDCLQQLAALFVQLKVHARRGGPLQAAMVISHVREGVSAWKRHLQCTACMESADSDTLLLCIVEIRMVLPMMEWISNNLDLSGQVAFSLQATPVSGSCQMPVAYELARGESQAIMRTLLLRSMDSVVDILAEIQERTSPMKRPGGLPPAFELHTPQPSPSSLSSPGCSRLFSVLEPAGGTQGLFGQPLQSLLESAENLQKRIAIE